MPILTVNHIHGNTKTVSGENNKCQMCISVSLTIRLSTTPSNAKWLDHTLDSIFNIRSET